MQFMLSLPPGRKLSLGLSAACEVLFNVLLLVLQCKQPLVHAAF
jgi:hypothetical protein